MQLLQFNRNGSIELARRRTEETLPKYAVLSHTWLVDSEEEVTFRDLMSGNTRTKKAGYNKIRFCGEQAAKDGLEYFWVDTCCINKESSAELQEAITTMFSWYRNAAKCYVYLSDVSALEAPAAEMDEKSSSSSWESAFRQSRWFTRGWTLQELLAPPSVEFFSVEGKRLGDKSSLEQWIHEITGIPHQALRGHELTNFSVSERLSWSGNRQTSRKEDRAYCLLGLFRIFMPLMYGEGEHAFTRLRDEIDKIHADNTRLDQYLTTLPLASEAAFNSLNNQHEPTCLPNTRSELLHEIFEWAEARDDRCIFWLNGLAGTGKSTVARTIARTFHDRGNLGASFFFSRGGGDISNANKLVTTLARQLAARIASARRYVCEAIMEHSDIAEYSLRDQWDQLILNPLSKLNKPSAPSTVVIVLDALDECDSERDIRVILRILASASSLSNIRLRIFITSRPEISIRYSLGKIPDAEREVFVLHQISQEIVDRDLSLFFQNSFSTIREERGLEDNWPGMRIINRLVEISCGLFIWASIACRFVREGRRMAMRRINILINGHRDNGGPEKQLDQIYITVLQNSIQQDYNDEEKAYLCEMLSEVLGSIVILFSPLSVESLANLLDIPLGNVNETLADLHTIFHIPDRTDRPIRLHHPTLRDFLLDKNRCSDLDFWVDEKKAHRALADSCITLMSKMLKRDICDLRSPGTFLKNVDPVRIEQCIPPNLQYACIYWVQHYRQSGIRFSDGDRVDRFFREHFLHWLEAINLTGKSAEMGAIIRLYHSLLEVRVSKTHGRLILSINIVILKPSENVRQLPFVKDARRFMFTFQSIIKQAPLQTYCAALAFIPPTNELKLHFRNQMHPWIKDIRVAEAITHKAKDEFNYVNDLAFSPDGMQIASGSQILAARLWDVATGAALYKFEGPADKVSSVAISPDGTLLAGGSDDFTVWVWDLRTRAVRYHLKAHSRWVNSVVFSPNGKLLASGSMDETVALWDIKTGQKVKRFDNQSSCVNCTAFSPDGTFIATGAVDQMVRLWDISNNSEDLRVLLDGHSGCINSVKFSPNGQCIVSGSDDTTIKLWDTVTGIELITLKGHTKKVMTVTFSLDARLIVSGSEDMTVKVWDATSGVELRTLTDHTSGLNSVLFSPNGQILASCTFDDEVQLWDTNTWSLRRKLDSFDVDVVSSSEVQQFHIPELGKKMESTELIAHSSRVTCVVFSPDGRLLASGSEDFTIKLWLREGVERWKLEGHSGRINHLTFSPTGHLLASASADKAVGLWNTTTGAAYPMLEGHSDNVLLTLFSSDGWLLASSSADKTIRLWDTVTRAALAKFEGHSDTVNDIVFSPDNLFIASCSADNTIRLWDVSTKAAPAVLEGHSGPVNSVAFSSDGELLVSCSDDTTIRLWSKGGEACGIIKSDGLQVNSVAFSPDRKLVVSCSMDATVRLWDSEIRSARGLLRPGVVIRKVSFSSCGRYIETDRGVLDIRLFTFSAPSLPLSSSHTRFVTQDWLTRDTENVIWLPEEYYPTDLATRAGAIVMGHSSGRISFIYV
jgi:WD40 repeat protein